MTTQHIFRETAETRGKYDRSCPAYLIECGSPPAVVYVLSSQLDMWTDSNSADSHKDDSDSFDSAATDEERATALDMFATFFHHFTMPGLQ